MNYWLLYSIFLLTALATGAGVQAQNVTAYQWERGIGSTTPSYSVIRDAVTAPNGDVFVCGYFEEQIHLTDVAGNAITLTSAGSADFFIARYNANGGLLWATRGGSSDWDLATALAIDNTNAVLVTGTFNAPATFGTVTLPGNGTALLRLDPATGAFQSGQRLNLSAGYLEVEVYDMQADAAGDVYLTGYHAAPFTVAGTDGNPIAVAHAGAFDGFVGRFTADGRARWVTALGTEGFEMGLALAVDNLGNCYATGQFENTLTLGPGVQLTSNGDRDIFLASYDANGTIRWAWGAGGTSTERGQGLGLDNANHVYVTGSFNSSSMLIGGETLANAGVGNIFLASYTSTGTPRWGRQLGGTGWDVARAVYVSPTGTSYLAGHFNSSLPLPNGTSLTAAGSNDILVASYTAAGTFRSAGRAGGTGSDVASAITGNAAGPLYVAGSFQNTASFPACTGPARTLTTVATGSADMFLARLATGSGVAQLLEPVNGATGVNANAYVSATPVCGATAYTFEVSTVSDFSANVRSVTPTGGSRVGLFQNLAWNQLYYLRVKTDVASDWSTPRSFTTGSPDSFSYLTEPANNAPAVNATLYATANLVANATSYTVEISTTSNFAAGTVLTATQSSRSFVFDLQWDTPYYSRVKTNLTPTTWGPVRTFRTGLSQNFAFVTSPANGATAVNPSGSLSLSRVVQATTYTVELFTNAGFTGTAAFSATCTPGAGNVCSVSYSGLLPSTTYHSRVKTNLAPTSWGPGRSFTTWSTTGSRYRDEAESVPATEPALAAASGGSQIRPNPFTHQTLVQVRTVDLQPLQITLTDLQGRQLERHQSQTNTEVSVGASLQPGVYLIYFAYGQQTLVERIVKY